jgi:hypothetical protein
MLVCLLSLKQNKAIQNSGNCYLNLLSISKFLLVNQELKHLQFLFKVTWFLFVAMQFRVKNNLLSHTPNDA